MFDDPRQRNAIPQPAYTKPGLAAALTIAVLWPFTNYFYRSGDLSKDWGTALLAVAAALAYVIARWWCKPKAPPA